MLLLTIVAIWAIGIPLAILGISWRAANLREAKAAQTAERSLSGPVRVGSRAGSVPACAVPAAGPRRTITRRVCPELARGAGRRPASA